MTNNIHNEVNMPQVGYDVFLAEPGVRPEAYCRVCRTGCTVRRDVVGPTGFAEAMAHKGHLHDAFVCPHTDAAWHQRALTLAVAIDEQPSKRVADLIRQDLAELLQQHLTAGADGQ